MTHPVTNELFRSAVISECGRYRYRLFREWEKSEHMPVLWVMLNPSTADAAIDDPTIRRCMAFSKSWGYGAMWVGNLYAFRATDPSMLWSLSAIDAHGPDNAKHLYAMACESAITVCGWGANAHGRDFAASFKSPGGLWCLGTTKGGQPRHPLYVKGDTKLQEWR